MANLQTLIKRVRNSIGEVSAGTWSDEEITDYLNQSQRLVCDDIHTPEVPWASTVPHYIPVVGGRYYLMPNDFLDVLTVGHRINQDTIYPMVKADVKSMYNNIPVYLSDIYENWQLSDIDAPYIAEGVATGGSATTLVDATPLVDLTGVQAGNTIFNLSDGDAQASVTAVDTSTGTVTFENWIGGNKRGFEVNDYYRIQQNTRDRDVLWVYPRVDNPNGSLTFSQNHFTPDADRFITGVVFDVTLAQNVDHEYSFRITTGDTVVAEGGLRENIKAIGNVAIVEPFYVRAGTEYAFTIIDQSGAVPPLTKLSLHYSDPYNRIELSYIPYPKPLTNANSTTELRLYQESLIRKAKQFAMEKIAADDTILLENLQVQYDRQVQRDRKKMIERGQGTGGVRVTTNGDRTGGYRQVSRRGVVVTGTTIPAR